MKLVGTHDLGNYAEKLIKRVRLIRRADGYYCQFCVAADRKETLEPSGNTIGLDVGLADFYTDSNGEKEENPRFYRKREAKHKKLARRVSRKKKGQPTARKQ